jgi:hypothetical protein
VGCGVSQIEMGYSYFYHDQDEEIEQAHTTPELMLRLGLTDDIEFRVRWNYVWLSVEEQEQDDGAEDLRWAFKLNVTEQDAWIPESALELRFTAPTGGQAFSTTRMEWGVDYIYDWALADACRFYGSTGVMANGLDDVGLLPEEHAEERFLVWSQSFALGLEVTDRVTVYHEVFGLFSYGLSEELTIVFYNVGVDFYVTDNVVLDYRIGVGLTDDADDVFSGVGGGFRF